MKNFVFVFIASIMVLIGCGRTNNNAAKESRDAVLTFQTKTELHSIINHSESFTVNTNEGEQITTQNGTRILIAPETFVTASGNTVAGPINVSFKAINSIEEIVASGIPMQADNNGEIGQFVSDGMFEINANSNGETVKVADGKTIQIFTKSRDEKSEFKYWFFNDKKGTWEETGTREDLSSDEDIAANIQKMGIDANTGLAAGNMRWIRKTQTEFIQFAAAMENVEIVPNKIVPGKYDPRKMTLDIQFNPTTYPDLAAYSSLMWQFAGTDPETDPARNNWIFQCAWNNVKLDPIIDKPGYFDLRFIAGGKEFQTIVRPVVSGTDLEKAESQYAEEMQKLEQLKKQKIEEGASTEQISQNMYNAFQVVRMGVYNCDRFYSDPNVSTYTANYIHEGKAMAATNTIYFIMDNRKGVIQSTAGNSNLRINPKTVDAIFTVIANGTIAAVSQSSLRSMREGGGPISLNFEKVKVKINSIGSLKQAIEQL